MKLIKRRSNYYVETKIKPYQCSKWGGFSPIDSSSTIKKARKIIQTIKKDIKLQGDKDLWKFRIMKRVEEDYIVELGA